MPKQTGTSRHQMQFFSLEEVISQDHPVRVIDAFVDSLDLTSLGFESKGKSQEGRPAFDTAMLLKLYLYGYQQGIRSSRKLQHACRYNIELWWLLEQQRPRYKTIADFRKVHPQALQQVFRQFVILCRHWSLVEGKTIAIDGSKFRAQNSRKNNYGDKKIARHLCYIDEKITTYLQEMEQADTSEDKEKAEQTAVVLEQLQQRRKQYEQLEQRLAEAKEVGEQQISTTDKDARAMPVHHGVVEVGYNVQSAVDAQHSLVVHVEATNVLDTYALTKAAIATKEIVGVEEMDVLADKGHRGTGTIRVQS